MTDTDINGHKRKLADQKGQKQTKTDRNGRKQIETGSCNVRMFSVCVFLCNIAVNPLPDGLESSIQKVYREYWHTQRRFGFLPL